MKKLLLLIVLVAVIFGCKKKTSTEPEPEPAPAPQPASTCTFTVGSGLTDIDGNVYTTVKIGNQEWMSQNLKVSKYRNGVSIPNVTDSAQWRALSTGAWCNQNNLVANDAVYGKLYNWFVTTNTNNIAPLGWHVPTSADWNTLINYLGGNSVAGDKLKESGTAHWQSPNNGTNCSGFNALPGGDRFIGHFKSIKTKGVWWTSTSSGSGFASIRNIGNATSDIASFDYNVEDGLYIRLVKD